MITAETEIIAKRFGLEPIPKSVLRLTSLIASQNADLEAIAGVIKEDPALAERLLRLAPPPRDKTQRPSEESAVQMALMRSGLSLIFLLARVFAAAKPASAAWVPTDSSTVVRPMVPTALSADCLLTSRLMEPGI